MNVFVYIKTVKNSSVFSEKFWRNSVKNSGGIPWKIPAEFREKFRWNSVKTPVGFFVFNSYLYEGIPTNTFFHINWFSRNSFQFLFVIT